MWLKERLQYGFSKGLVFVLVVSLAVVLMQFKSYNAYDRFYNVRSFFWGAEPSLNAWAVLAVFLLYLFLFGRLIMSVIPSSSSRPRWFSSLVALPAAGILFGALDVCLVLVMDNYSEGRLAEVLGLFLATGLAACLAASALIIQGVYESAGGVFSKPKELFKILPLVVICGAVIYALKIASFYLVLVPFAGPALRAAANLTLTLWFFRFPGKRAGGEDIALPRPPGPSFAYFFCFLSIITVGMTIVVPGTPYHPDAEDVPSLAMVKNMLRPVIEKREDTVIMDSRELMVVIRKEPFSFALLDSSNRKVLLKLLDEKDRSGDYQGIALNLEPKAVAVSPWPGSFKTLTGKVRLSSSSFAAPEFSFSEDSVTAESRIGVRPVAVTFSFYDEEVLKITLEPGPRSAMRSVSMSFFADEKERFLGIGRTGKAFSLKGKEIDLMAGPESKSSGSGPGPVSGLTDGRIEFSSGTGGLWPVPFVYFSRGIGVFMAESVDGEIEVQTRYPDAVRFSSRGGPVTFFIIKKNAPLQVLEKYHHMVPPPRRLDPRILAPWSSATLEETCNMRASQEMEVLRKNGIPAGNLYVQGLCALSLDRLDRNCKGFNNTAAAADELGFELAADDVVWLPPHGADYRQALRQGLLAKNALGLPYHFMTGKGTRTILDFTNHRAMEWRAKRWKRLADMGISTFMLDPHCILPPDAELYNNETGYAMRNFYPVIYGRALQNSFKKDVRISSSLGYPLMETVASMSWTAEGWSENSRRSLEEGIRRGVGPAMAGVQATAAFGPSSIPKGSANHESMLQRTGLGAMLPLFFVPRGMVDYSESGSRQPVKDLSKPARTHARLFPYFYSLSYKSEREGTPMAFHCALLGRDEVFFEVNDQFMLGESLLVALPEEPGRKKSTVRFPKGKWTDLSSMKVFKEGVHEVSGNGTRPLMFLREGHLLPLFDEPMQTFTSAGETAKSHVSLDKDVNITWSAGEPADFLLFDGAAISARGSADSMVFRVSGGMARSYTLRVLDCDRPAAIKKNGETLPAYSWKYLERPRILQVSGLKGPDLEVIMVMQ